ncbi:MAG TPA: transporter [Gemmatimonadales bacterium]|nr:transporter [Gemmatimonadales bacterium]
MTARDNRKTGGQSKVNRGGRHRALYRRSLLTVQAFLLLATSPLLGQIQDNSFLLEEAYNQEHGVVQHISTFERADGGDWEFGFTQEWPLGGIRHQLSYTVPVQHGEIGTGLGDVALNYRYQLAGDPEARTVMAPRLSLLLPTGDEKEGRGTGGVGIQGNVPLTLVLSERFVTHWNAGATVTPSARGPFGGTASTTTYNLGASVIWLFRPSFNFMAEMAWADSRTVVADGRTLREESLVLNPGVRWAFDLPGDLQIVPGVAYTIGLSEGPDENAVFLYLSFEHPFKR